MRLRDSLDIWYPWLIAAIIALILAARACQPTPAHAGDWSLDLKGGLTFPIRTTPDGTYYQEPYPHQTKLLTGASGLQRFPPAPQHNKPPYAGILRLAFGAVFLWVGYWLAYWYDRFSGLGWTLLSCFCIGLGFLLLLSPGGW